MIMYNAVEVVAAIGIRSSVFWAVMPHIPVKVSGASERAYHLLPRILRIKQTRNGHAAGSKQRQLLSDMRT
jgi:hypothetical protein